MLENVPVQYKLSPLFDILLQSIFNCKIIILFIWMKWMQTDLIKRIVIEPAKIFFRFGHITTIIYCKNFCKKKI